MAAGNGNGTLAPTDAYDHLQARAAAERALDEDAAAGWATGGIETLYPGEYEIDLTPNE